MPLEITCASCGAILYSGFDLKPPKDVIRSNGDKCKGCGKTLMISDFGIEVSKN
ncbi:MAG: hypothetical protein ACYCPP_08500 [Nitrososphaerales archaeon]